MLPAVVDAPVDVLRVLRGFNSALDLYVLPDGRVWLLWQSMKPARIQAGRDELFEAKLEGFDEPMYSASLMAQGFEQLGEYPFFFGMSAGAMLAIAQEKLYATERQIVAAMARRRSKADGTDHKARAVATMRDRVTSGARSDHAWAYRGRRSFSNVR